MKNGAVILMILGAAFSRFLPHAPNMTAVTAMALLGGAYLSNRTLVVLMPIAALWLSDLVLGFHETMLFVYGSMALIALCASYFLKDWSRSKLAILSLSSSLFFFAVTNFGVWIVGGLYPRTLAGLMECYVMAIPFLGTQVLGDLFFTTVLFGSAEALKAWKPAWIASV